MRNLLLALAIAAAILLVGSDGPYFPLPNIGGCIIAWGVVFSLNFSGKEVR